MSTLKSIADASGTRALTEMPPPMDLPLAPGESAWSGNGASRSSGETGLPAGPLTHDETCDVLIVGGGVSGAFAAQQLAMAGVDVALVDRAEPAGGSTRLSTALIQYEPDLPLVSLIPKLGLADAQAVYRQTRSALDDLRRLIEERRLDCDLVQRQSLYLARDAVDIPHLQHETFAREQIGLAAPFVDAATLRSFFDIDRPGALRSPIAYELDPRKLTFALLADAVANGARVYDHTSVNADPWVGGLPALRTQDGHSIHCDHVVYATGYGAIDQFPALRPLCEMRTTYVALIKPRRDDEPSKWWRDADRPMLWELGDPYLYARSAPGGRILIGGGDERGYSPEAAAAALRAKTASLLEQFQRMTGIGAVQVEHAFGAAFAQTPDGLPFIGSPDCSDRCFFSLGYGGNGILFSLIAGEIVRDRMLGRSHPAERLFGFARRSARQIVPELNVGSCP